MRLVTFDVGMAATATTWWGTCSDQQLADGGWNRATRTDKSKHSSCHTSIQALEALAGYASSGGRFVVAERRGREFFLEHRSTRHTGRLR